MKVEGIGFVGIESPDPAGLASFFAGAFGIEAKEDQGFFTFVFPGGDAMAVIPPGHLGEGTDTIVGFLVDDVEAASEELVARGAELDGPLFASEVFRWQHLRAPDGRYFEVLDRRV